MARAERAEVIVGIHAVAEALAAGERVEQLTIAAHRAREPVIREITEEARRRGVAVKIEEEGWFRRFTQTHRGKFPRLHQHVIAQVAPFEYADWRSVLAAVGSSDECIIVAIDHIEDPQNLGAILRSAEGAGALAVILPQRRAAPITAAVRRAAAGAASHLRIVRVPNLVRALGDLKKIGCWVYGLAPAGQASDFRSIDYARRAVLVVGSESKGLQRLAVEHCDVLVRIPMCGRVDSLNAAAATAVVLFELVRRPTKGSGSG